jgi:hypothetical protein
MLAGTYYTDQDPATACYPYRTPVSYPIHAIPVSWRTCWLLVITNLPWPPWVDQLQCCCTFAASCWHNRQPDITGITDTARPLLVPSVSKVDR